MFRPTGSCCQTDIFDAEAKAFIEKLYKLGLSVIVTHETLRGKCTMMSVKMKALHLQATESLPGKTGRKKSAKKQERDRLRRKNWLASKGQPLEEAATASPSTPPAETPGIRPLEGDRPSLPLTPGEAGKEMESPDLDNRSPPPTDTQARSKEATQPKNATFRWTEQHKKKFLQAAAKVNSTKVLNVSAASTQVLEDSDEDDVVVVQPVRMSGSAKVNWSPQDYYEKDYMGRNYRPDWSSHTDLVPAPLPQWKRTRVPAIQREYPGSSKHPPSSGRP